jgi:hypothetical protein
VQADALTIVRLPFPRRGRSFSNPVTTSLFVRLDDRPNRVDINLDD